MLPMKGYQYEEDVSGLTKEFIMKIRSGIVSYYTVGQIDIRRTDTGSMMAVDVQTTFVLGVRVYSIPGKGDASVRSDVLMNGISERAAG